MFRIPNLEKNRAHNILFLYDSGYKIMDIAFTILGAVERLLLFGWRNIDKNNKPECPGLNQLIFMIFFFV